MNTFKPTPQQRQAVRFIDRYQRANSRPPTLAEIAGDVYGKPEATSNAASELIQPLIKAGFLYRAAGGGTRAIMVTVGGVRDVVNEGVGE
jgi:hypothetical protein